MVFTKLTGLLLSLAALVAVTRAFQTHYGTACTGTGACTYQYPDLDKGQTITVNGFCSPRTGICADNGAPCTSDAGCYDYCGLEAGANAVCGGLGAACNTQDPFTTNQFSTACDTPSYVCTTDGSDGQCVLGASMAARSKARRSDIMHTVAHQKIARNSVKVSDLRRAARAAA